jgi:hypothetical protein
LQNSSRPKKARFLATVTRRQFVQQFFAKYFLSPFPSVYNGTVAQFNYFAPTAPTYLLQGASGNLEGKKKSYPPLSEQPEWVAVQEVRVGYGLLTITATTLQWKYYASSNSTSPTVLLDTMTIKI